MLFADVVQASAVVSATRSRLAKTEALAAVLRVAAEDAGGEGGTDGAGVRAVAGFLTGVPVQGRIGAGWRTLARVGAEAGVGVEGASAATLTVAEVDLVLGELAGIGGVGAQGRRGEVLAGLMGRATRSEQDFLVRLLTGELRQGALEGVMLDAIGKACGVSGERVRRAFMLSGSLPDTAAVALLGGGSALDGVGLEVGRGVRPMLASPGSSLVGALAELGGVCSG